MEDWERAEIPVDLLIEIAARLPAKSVMRFKCISKLWLSLPLSRNFCNRFLTYQSKAQPRLYMSLVDRKDYSKSQLVSTTPIPSTTSCPSSLEIDQDLTIDEIGGQTLRVLRGFICFSLHKKARIYNPSTRQLVILPAVQESDIIAAKWPHYILPFIVHDPVADQYKILCTVTTLPPRAAVEEEEVEDDDDYVATEHWVFVLEAGGWWKRVAKDVHTHRPTYQQVTMNNVLYYRGLTDSHTRVLVSFDIRSEELSMIQVPGKAGDVLSALHRVETVINYGGKVALFDMSFLNENGMVDLWVVEDWRNQEWSRKTLYLQPCQLHLLTPGFFPEGTTLKDQCYLLEATKRSHKTCLQLYARPQDDMKLVSRLGQDLKLRELVWRLCCWRDLMARIHDESRSYVLSDEAIMNLASQEPRTPGEICKAVSAINSGSNMLDDISIDDESSVSETIGCHLDYLQQLISEKLVPLEQILPQILDKSLGSNGTCPVNLFNRSIRESFKINPLGSPMRSGKDSRKESMTSKPKWKCGKCVKCGKDGKEMVSYRKIPLAYRKHFPDHLNEDRSSDTVLLCEDCHRLAQAAGENFKRKLSSEIGLCSPVGDTKECQDIRRAAKALLYKSSALPEQRRKEMMETVEKHYGRGNLSRKDLESAQQIGLSSKREKQETSVEKQTIEYLLKNSGEDGVRRFCQEWRDQFDSL